MSLLLDNYTIELGDEANLALSKSIYDVIEPDKRKSAFTKTITICSSPQNDKVFNGLFEVNFSLDQSGQFAPFFNPAKKAPCYIHTDTMEQMTGYAQLTDVVLNHYTNKVEYNITIYGEVRDLFGELADKKLGDLDLSKYNHAYTKANIVSSWDYDVYENGVLQTYSEGGNGYVYPQVDYGDDHQKWNGTVLESSDYWKVEHFRPFIYCKTIVDQIFKESGFSYYSNFFNSSLFKKLIYQGDVNGLTYSNDEIADRTAAVYRTTDQSITSGNNTPLDSYTSTPIIFNAETSDPSNINNTTTGTFTVLETTRYNVGMNLYLRFTNNLTAPNTIQFQSAKLLICGIKSNGDIFFSTTVVPPFSGNYAAGATFDFTVTFGDTVNLNIGEEFRVCVHYFECAVQNITYSRLEYYVGIFPFTVLNNSTFVIQPVASLPKGGTVNISQMLSDDITQKDFLLGLAKMFNLYIEPYWFRVGDANSGKYAQYLVEPRDDYFTEDVIDWTSNLDIEKDFTIKPMALSQYKYYHFSYKEDNDKYNSDFKGATGRIYGDYVHFIDNDFSKDVKKIEIPFSPCIVAEFYNRGRAIPINKVATGGVRKDGKPKILFYQGNLTTAAHWSFEGENKSTCPFSGQLDNITAPTCDLNFKVPPIIFYKGDGNSEVVLTSSTLFNKYYYRQVYEMNDKNSKMVECYMRLRPDDIHNLSFRPLYFIKNAYYRLYEVIDHNYSETTLCKFLKINVVNPIDNANYITKGGRGVFGTLGDKLPIKASPTDGIRLGGFGEPVGSGNGGVVMGGDTSTERKSNGLLGTGILQAGTSQSVITKDDVIDFGYQYINIASGSHTIYGNEGSPLYIFCDTTLGDINIYLPDYTTNYGKLYKVYKTPSANQVKVYDSDDVLIHTITSSGAAHEFFIRSTGVILLE